MLIDSHCHILDNRLDADSEACGMTADGLSAIVESAYDLSSSHKAADLADRYARIFCTVGCHPEEAGGYKESDRDEYLELCTRPKVVAVGEIGLDYCYEISPRDVQKKVFLHQLYTAHEAKKPVVLHIRDALGDAFELLSAHKSLLTDGMLLHCYGGSREMAERFTKEFDAYFSFGGVITFKNAKKDDIVRAIPRDRLMLETDCPYMTPVPYRGQTNRPAYVAFVAEKAAQILETSKEEIAQTTALNACRFYRLPEYVCKQED